jgi:hypothetical protein
MPTEKLHRGWETSVFFAILFLGPLATSAVPLLAPIFIICLSTTIIGTAWHRGMQARQMLSPTAALTACLLLAGYMFINAFWSADFATALRKVGVFASLVLMSFAAARALSVFDDHTLGQGGILFAAGVFTGGVFLLFEVLTHGFIIRTVINHIPFLLSYSPKYFQIDDGRAVGMDLDQLSHHIGLMTYNFWPGLLALTCLARPVRLPAMITFIVTPGLAVVLSGNAASQVALLGSSLVVLTAWHWPHRIVWGLVICWCASFVLVLPASFFAYQTGLHLATWLPDTARERIIIWEYTAEQVPKHPLLGVGIESTPVLNQQQKLVVPPDQPAGFLYPRSLGSHAHDIYLQSWFELGAVGTLLLATAGVCIVLLVLSLPLSAQPFAAGTFAAFCIVGAFSWGMWQAWFMCQAAMLPLFLRIAAVTSEKVSGDLSFELSSRRW